MTCVELGAHLGPVGLDFGDPGELFPVIDRPVAVDGERGDGRLHEIPQRHAQFRAGMLGREAAMPARVLLPRILAQ